MDPKSACKLYTVLYTVLNCIQDICTLDCIVQYTRLLYTRLYCTLLVLYSTTMYFQYNFVNSKSLALPIVLYENSEFLSASVLTTPTNIHSYIFIYFRLN